jgi:hypothetical protein
MSKIINFAKRHPIWTYLIIFLVIGIIIFSKNMPPQNINVDEGKLTNDFIEEWGNLKKTF